MEKNASAGIPTLTRGDSEKLLSRIMTNLDMQPKKPSARRSYREKLMARFLLPKVVLICVLLGALVLATFTVATPAGVAGVDNAELDNGAQRISFSVDKSMLLHSVSAMLNDAPVPVAHTDAEGYYVDAEENGLLILETETIVGARTTETVQVEGVDMDRTAPVITDDMRDGDAIRIYLSDGDGKGIDWAGITVVGADDGAAVGPVTFDEAEGYVCVPFPTERVYISIPDNVGNVLTAVLAPVGSDT